MTNDNQPFLTDVETLRSRARTNIEKGAVTPSYQGDIKQTIDILQSVLATEIVCVLRYTMNAIAASGLASEGIKAEFAEHAIEEQEHMRLVAERINQLGGTPNFNPEGLATRSASQYTETTDLIEMIQENLVAERIACEHYSELVRFFGDKDPGTRVLMGRILIKEEEHANDMHDLLVNYKGKSIFSSNQRAQYKDESMIDIYVLPDGILKVQISGKLEDDDFKKIAPQIDQIITAQGSIKLLIDATGFEGWQDMHVANEHFAFVREHHHKITRMALVAGHTWQHWVVGIASVFVHPKIKVFEKDQLAEAEAWLQG